MSTATARVGTRESGGMPIHHRRSDEAGTVAVRPQFTHAGELPAVPRLDLPQHEMPADSAYQIVRLLPSDGADYQYRIKSPGEAFERVAKESQLEVSRL